MSISSAIVEHWWNPTATDKPKNTYNIRYDPNNIVKVDNEGFILDPGKYKINFSGPNVIGNGSTYKSALYNGTTLIAIGTVEYSCAAAHPECNVLLNISTVTKYNIKQFAKVPFPNGIIGNHYITITKFDDEAKPIKVVVNEDEYVNIDVNDVVKKL